MIDYGKVSLFLIVLLMVVLTWLVYPKFEEKTWCSGSGRGPIDCPRDYPHKE